jgi:2,4-dienoyl-CoA reductase-like NADH-dependent reductase (Old Yellow Enzyme family)
VAELFEKVALKNICLRNRLVRSATETLMGTPEEGRLTQGQVQLYERLAAEDVGLIIYENTAVSPEGRSFVNQTAIWDDSYVEGFAALTERVHRYPGARVIIQLGHGGGKDGIEKHNGNRTPLRVNAMDAKDLGHVREAFVQAALRAQKAGFDGVQLHSAHGYLLDQFFSLPGNKRADVYGGVPQNRFRLCGEIVEQIKERCGDNFPVFIKINGDNEFENEAHFEALCLAAQTCKDLGVEAMEISGVHSARKAPFDGPYFLDTACRLKKVVDLPLAVVGGVRSRRDAESIVEAGMALVSISRPLIADEDFITRTLKNGERSRCISCNRCFTLPVTEKRRCTMHAKHL